MQRSLSGIRNSLYSSMNWPDLCFTCNELFSFFFFEINFHYSVHYKVFLTSGGESIVRVLYWPTQLGSVGCNELIKIAIFFARRKNKFWVRFADGSRKYTQHMLCLSYFQTFSGRYSLVCSQECEQNLRRGCKSITTYRGQLSFPYWWFTNII